MSTKHTPGPWRQDTGYLTRSLIVDQNGVAIAAAYNYKPDQIEANIRLIAAAPKLLEALLGIVEIGKRDMSNPKYNVYFAEARAALADAGVDLP